MSSRSRKLVMLAQKLPPIDIIEDEHNDENDLDVSNISHIENCFLDTNITISDLLSPEDVAEIIQSAEVVFEDSLSEADALNTNSTEKCLIGFQPNSEFYSSVVGNLRPNKNEVIDLPEGVSNILEPENSNEVEVVSINDDYVSEDSSEERRDAEETQLNRTKNESISNIDDGNKEIINIENKDNHPKRKRKGANKREINKKLRMEGKAYVGFRKPTHQKNTFHDTKREERKIKERCNCREKAKKPTKKCYLITNEKKEKLFKKFWSDMTWEQRKVFVGNTVKIVEKQRPTKDIEESRRTQTIKYSLVIDGQSIPVCKKMYLHTTGLGEWSVRSWVMKSEDGMSTKDKKEISMREKRMDSFQESRGFLEEFLKGLNKLPSHYCRKETERLYLEQTFQSWSSLYKVYEQRCHDQNQSCLSITSMTNLAEKMKISLFRPRKDQCDTCFKYKNGNLEEEEYNIHIQRKDLARKEKEEDKKMAIAGECHVITVDVQAVKLSPHIPASSLYYKQKLCCHNFTLYNLVNNQATCYWFDETVADGQAATYASFLVNYLEEHFLQEEIKKTIIIYSDGCTAQNRNSILANALLYVSEKYCITIFQKFLEKGHTQMECDSVHSAIERALKHKEIYLPSDYIKITKQARLKNPYVVKSMDFDFFLNYGHKDSLKYSSIRPSKLNNDVNAVVTNIRALKYFDGKIFFKLSFSDEEFTVVPTRPKKLDFNNVVFPPLYNSRIPITKKKYDHLQSIKTTIPKDCWTFYDQLPFKE